MALRAKKPEAVDKRLKLFMFGPAGVGKTTAAIQFPNSYIIDGEKGSENYAELINASGSQVFHTTDMYEVQEELRALQTEKHDFRTVVIDPITTLYNDLLEKCEVKVGTEFGRHYGEAKKIMKRIFNTLMALDMNVCITAHAKKEYGPKLEVLGITFDGEKSLDYLFDLVVQLEKRGKRRVGIIRKTRIATFPDGEVFDWGYPEIKARYDAATLERAASPVSLASAEQVAEINALLDTVKVADGWVDGVLRKAGVEEWADMPADKIQKCIEQLTSRIARREAGETVGAK